MNRVLPSLLAASPGQWERQVDILKKSWIKYLHIDMMDGIYVPKYAFPIDELEHIQKCTDFLLDVHIMTTNPEAMAVKVAQLGVDTVSLHYEACKEPQKFLERVKCFGVHTGIVLNPETPVAVLNSDLLDICDTIQLMSVEPGIAGQTFIRHTLTRIQQICEIVKTKKTALKYTHK